MAEGEGEREVFPPPNGHEIILGGGGGEIPPPIGGRGGKRLPLGGGKGGRGGRGRDGDDDNEEDPYGFPIQDIDSNFNIKNISPFVLLNFHDMWTKDPKTLLFKFELHCRSYDYSQEKFNLFPATLKYGALKWFMG